MAELITPKDKHDVAKAIVAGGIVAVLSYTAVYLYNKYVVVTSPTSTSTPTGNAAAPSGSTSTTGVTSTSSTGSTGSTSNTNQPPPSTGTTTGTTTSIPTGSTSPGTTTQLPTSITLTAGASTIVAGQSDSFSAQLKDQNQMPIVGYTLTLNGAASKMTAATDTSGTATFTEVFGNVGTYNVTVSG